MSKKMCRIVFSGVITGLAGMVIGVAATKIGHPDFKTYRYQSAVYTNIYKNYIWFGAILGLTVGVAQQCVMELKYEKDQVDLNYKQQNNKYISKD